MAGPLVLAQQVPSELAGWLTGSAVSVLAFGILAFVRGWIVSGGTHARVLKEKDEEAAERRALQAIFLDKVVPTLVRANDLIAKFADQHRNG